MKEYLVLLEKATEAMQCKEKVLPDEVKDLLATRMVESLLCLSSDFERHRETLSPHGLAVIARSAIESMYHLKGAMHSKELAVDIFYSSVVVDLNKVRMMDKVDPDSNPHAAQTVIDDLLAEQSFLESVVPNHTPTKRSIFTIAEKIGCESHYRTNYFILSQYAHSNYATFGLKSYDLILNILDKSVMEACLFAAETIAEHYSHPEEDEILDRCRTCWKELD